MGYVGTSVFGKDLSGNYLAKDMKKSSESNSTSIFGFWLHCHVHLVKLCAGNGSFGAACRVLPPPTANRTCPSSPFPPMEAVGGDGPVALLDSGQRGDEATLSWCETVLAHPPYRRRPPAPPPPVTQAAQQCQ